MKDFIKEIAKLTFAVSALCGYCIEVIAMLILSFYLFDNFLHAIGLAAIGWLCLAILLFVFAWLVLIALGLIMEEIK